MTALTELAYDFVNRNRPNGLIDFAHRLDGLSDLQQNVVNIFGGVNYESHTSYECPRYRVSLMDSEGAPTVASFRSDHIFVEGGLTYLTNIYTDETHEPEGLDHAPDGSVGISGTVNGFAGVYASLSVPVERDAILEKLGLAYRGSLICDAGREDEMLGIIRRHADHYDLSSDHLNDSYLAEDVLCIMQKWLGIYDAALPGMHTGATVRVFARDGRTAARFGSKVAGVAMVNTIRVS